jgi:hypothetical protein
MNDPTAENRRRFLEGVGVGGATLLAGCTGQFDLGGDAGTAEQSGTDGGVESAAAIPAIDRTAMREEQAAIQQDVQSGDMEQAEAQEEMAALQEKYMSEAMDALTDTLEGTDGVSVGERYDSLGAIVVDGEAGAILSVLASEDVNALVSVADVEEQAQTRTRQG